MVNPFDSNFFKFLGGFILILGISFVVIIVTQKFVETGNSEVEANAVNSAVILKR